MWPSENTRTCMAITLCHGPEERIADGSLQPTGGLLSRGVSYMLDIWSVTYLICTFDLCPGYFCLGMPEPGAQSPVTNDGRLFGRFVPTVSTSPWAPWNVGKGGCRPARVEGFSRLWPSESFSSYVLLVRSVDWYRPQVATTSLPILPTGMKLSVAFYAWVY